MKEYRANIPVLLSISALLSLVLGSLYLLFFSHLYKSEFLELLWSYSIVTIPIAGVWLFFEHLGWRWKFVRHILKSTLKFPPDLRGRWEGEIDRSGENNPHDFVFEISQTFTKITVTSFSESSEFQSIVADFTTAPSNDDHFKLCFLWQGETKNPLQGEQNQSGHFYGFTICKYVQKNEERFLIGEYFTSRKPKQTRGVLTVKWTAKKTIGNFN